MSKQKKKSQSDMLKSDAKKKNINKKKKKIWGYITGKREMITGAENCLECIQYIHVGFSYIQ